MKTTTVLLVLMLCLPGAVLACGGSKEGKWEINVWGLSHHLESAPRGRVWNQVNPGVGLRRYINPTRNCLEIFGEVDWMARNSTGGSLTQMGVGVQYPIFSIGRATLLVGGVGGAFAYQNKWEHQTYVNPGAYPLIAVRYETTTMTMGYIPHVSFRGRHTYGALFYFLGFRF